MTDVSQIIMLYALTYIVLYVNYSSIKLEEKVKNSTNIYNEWI